MYIAKFTEAVYVLHCFQKKTEKTSKADMELAATRYRDLVKELGSLAINILSVCGMPSRTRPPKLRT